MTDVNYENIERYLAGDMSEKERDSFENELDENEDLAQELHFYMYVNQSISECLHHHSSFKYYDEHTTFKSLNSKKQQDMSTIRWVALITIALIFGCILIWSPWQNNRIKEATKVKMNAVSAEGIPVDNKYADIIDLFNKNKYAEVLPLLNNALTEKPDDLYIRYYRGLTFLNLKYLGSARRDFLKIYSENTLQMYEAAYYIALSYTEEEDEDDYKESALNWLKKIPKDSPIYPKAEELRKTLI